MLHLSTQSINCMSILRLCVEGKKSYLSSKITSSVSICKFSSVILKEIVTRDVKLVLHGYLKYKEVVFVFYIDFYFGFLLVIGVYNCKTKISEVHMVRVLIFLKI